MSFPCPLPPQTGVPPPLWLPPADLAPVGRLLPASHLGGPSLVQTGNGSVVLVFRICLQRAVVSLLYLMYCHLPTR